MTTRQVNSALLRTTVNEICKILTFFFFVCLLFHDLDLADLLTGPLIVLVDIVTKLTEYWYAGDALCKMLKFSQVLSLI